MAASAAARAYDNDVELSSERPTIILRTLMNATISAFSASTLR